MISPISPGFLLWSQLLLVWSFATYGINADPLKGESGSFPWRIWSWELAFRAIIALVLSYVLSRSLWLSLLVLIVALLQPLLRYVSHLRWVAEFEVCSIVVFLASTVAVIRYLHLSAAWMPIFILPSRLAALCILASALFVVVRGGTYIVRGVLRKSGTLKAKDKASFSNKGSALPEEFLVLAVDPQEYNRGRLIGNLERVVLTIVVAAGSYAALAFLVTAKGVVRFGEFEKSRDFTEYFLIGSLASVLVALCAGILLRFAFVHLWPDLLSLQMQ